MLLVFKEDRTGSNNLQQRRFRLDIKTTRTLKQTICTTIIRGFFLREDDTNFYKEYPGISNNALENMIVQIIYQNFIQL